MKKQKSQSKIINFLGVIVGIIFLLVAFTPSPTNDTSSALILGVLGLLFIGLSLSPLGDTDIQNPYVRIILFPFVRTRAYASDNIWYYLIFGILFIAAFGALIVFAPNLLQSWLRRN